MKLTNEKIGLIELVVAMILSGTIGFFVLEAGQSSFNVVFYRCLFGMLSLGLFCFAKGLFKREYFQPKTLSLIALGGLCIVFNWVLLFKSYTLTSITVGTVVYHTQPFFVLFLGSVLFKEQIGAHKITWTVLAFIGVVMISKLDTEMLMNPGNYTVGIGYALGAAILYGIATLIAKQLKHVKPHVTAFLQVTLGVCCLYPFADFAASPTTSAAWSYLLILGVVHTCLMYILLYSSFQKLKVSQIAVLSFIYPAVSIVVDYVVYGYTITALQGLGIVFIFASSLGVNRGWKIIPERTTSKTKAVA